MEVLWYIVSEPETVMWRQHVQEMQVSDTEKHCLRTPRVRTVLRDL